MKTMLLMAVLGLAATIGMGTRTTQPAVAGVYHCPMIPVWTIGGVPIPREELPTA